MAKKTYTVSTVLGTYAPSIRLTGKWLAEKGFDVGDKLEVIEGKNMIILVKVPQKELEQQQKVKKISEYQRQIQLLNN